MTTIKDFRDAINAKLDEAAAIYGEESDLSTSAIDDVSRNYVDAANETVNPNLPPRPKE